jgi:lysophospholipase L1-like esterase
VSIDSTMIHVIRAFPVIGDLAPLFVSGNVAPIPPATPGTTRVACVGDSVTYGAFLKDRARNCYPAQLQALLGDAYSVRNFGVDGHAVQESADHPYCKHANFSASGSFDPDVVLLMLGSNDARSRNWQGIEAFIRDYGVMVEHYLSLESAPRVVVLKPPAAFAVWGRRKLNYTIIGEALGAIASKVREIAVEQGLPLVDINSATATRADVFPDGVHPDTDGARLIATTACEHLRPLLLA